MRKPVYPNTKSITIDGVESFVTANFLERMVFKLFGKKHIFNSEGALVIYYYLLGSVYFSVVAVAEDGV